MKHIIVSSISSLTCGIIMAQVPAGEKNFSIKLKELVKSAGTGFKTIPLDIRLKGALTSRILKAQDKSLYYRSVFGDKITGKKADSLVKQLTQKINSALGKDYEYQTKPKTKGIREIYFVNKTKSSPEEIILTSQCVLSACKVYIDIIPGKANRDKIENDPLGIAARIKKIIIDKLGVTEAEVNSEASFTNDLGADSLDTVELLMEFEKEFNISIPDEDCEGMTTVGEAITYLKKRVK